MLGEATALYRRTFAFSGAAAKNKYNRPSAARAPHVVRVGVDGALVELRRFACGLPNFSPIDQVPSTGFTVVRGDLQCVAELDAGLLEITRSEERLPLFEVPGLARLRAAAAGKDERREASRTKQQTAHRSPPRHIQSPRFFEGEREFRNS